MVPAICYALRGRIPRSVTRHTRSLQDRRDVLRESHLLTQPVSGRRAAQRTARCQSSRRPGTLHVVRGCKNGCNFGRAARINISTRTRSSAYNTKDLEGDSDESSIPAFTDEIDWRTPSRDRYINSCSAQNTVGSTRPWMPQRLADGQPDIQGMWNNEQVHRGGPGIRRHLQRDDP
jgi:hypothetical protein